MSEESYLEAALGQHFTGQVAGVNFFPLLQLSSGLSVSERSTVRLSLGGGGTEVRGSARSAYDGCRMMVGNASVAWLYALVEGEAFRLLGGVEGGFWFAALWGENDERLTAGSANRYLEQVSAHYGLLLGVELPLTSRWTFSVESRLNAAMTEWDGALYNTGGLSVLLGLLYALGSAGP